MPQDFKSRNGSNSKKISSIFTKQTSLTTQVKALSSSNILVVKASTSGAADSGLVPSRIKTMTLNLVFAACCSAQKRQRENQAGKFTCAVEKDTNLGVVDRWLVTP